MPNHVYNTLKITGERSMLEKFAREQATQIKNPAKGQDPSQLLDFNVIAPCPEIFHAHDDGGITAQRYKDDSLLKNYLSPRWYEWQVLHWGTKWNAYEIDTEHDLSLTSKEPHLLYRFLTAWSPPEAWLKEAGTWYPSLTFQMCFEEEAQMYPHGTFRIVEGRFKELKGCRIN